MEDQSNDYAQSVVVPREFVSELYELKAKRNGIIGYARKIGIAPGIVVGQLQHLDILGRDHMIFLKRRYDWNEVEAAFV